MTRCTLFLSLNALFLGSTAYESVVLFFFSLFTVHIVTQQLLDIVLFFCYKSEMTRKQLPAIQSQWRVLDCGLRLTYEESQLSVDISLIGCDTNGPLLLTILRLVLAVSRVVKPKS